MHLSVFAMSILLGFGIWTVAGEPRLKFTNLSSSHASADASGPISEPAAGLTSGTATGDQAVQN